MVHNMYNHKNVIKLVLIVNKLSKSSGRINWAGENAKLPLSLKTELMSRM